MSASQQKLEAIFDAALELSPAERELYLARSCGQDAELRQQVDKLLRALDRAGNFLTHQEPTPIGEAPPRAAAPSDQLAVDKTLRLPAADELSLEKRGMLIGRYKL